MKLKLFFMLMWMVHVSHAQLIKEMDIAVMGEAVAFPFSRFGNLHPGIQIGASFRQIEKQKSVRNYNAFIGFYHHQDLENAFYLRAEYAHTFVVLKKIGIITPIGLGYLHTFYPGQVYSQNEDGTFSQVTQLGRPHAIATTGLGLSYRGFTKFEPYLQHDIMIQFPFSKVQPFLPHSFLKLGVKLKIQ